jgi:hypothetical protein
MKLLGMKLDNKCYCMKCIVSMNLASNTQPILLKASPIFNDGNESCNNCKERLV